MADLFILFNALFVGAPLSSIVGLVLFSIALVAHGIWRRRI
jgi:hypothetical protein